MSQALALRAQDHSANQIGLGAYGTHVLRRKVHSQTTERRGSTVNQCAPFSRDMKAITVGAWMMGPNVAVPYGTLRCEFIPNADTCSRINAQFSQRLPDMAHGTGQGAGPVPRIDCDHMRSGYAKICQKTNKNTLHGNARTTEVVAHTSSSYRYSMPPLARRFEATGNIIGTAALLLGACTCACSHVEACQHIMHGSCPPSIHSIRKYSSRATQSREQPMQSGCVPTM